MRGFERRDEFSKDEYAALGKLLVAAINMDDVIGRSAVTFLVLDREAQATTSPAKNDEQVAEIIGSSSTSRLRRFRKVVAASENDAAWLDPLMSEIENVLHWRNALCHGRFTRGSCGSIRVEFFDKSSAKNFTVPPEGCLSVDEAAALANEANRLSFEIHNRFLSQ